MSSYFDAQFRPRAARPGEVTLLIPNLMNPSETLPVHVKKEDLFNLYMSLFGDPAATADPGSDPQSGVGRTNMNYQVQW